MISPAPVQDANSEADLILRRGNVWIVLAGWLCVAGPLFVCMPLNSDTALYDVQARLVLDGGVAYRDIVEPNLPGALWGHIGIRTVLGWSSEVIRTVDLVVLLALLSLWTTLGRNWRNTLPVTILAGTFFYLTRNEWCHVQRDMWMLLPAGCALRLRLKRSQETVSGWKLPLMEGMCWGCAFWIKPHIAIPAAAVILTDIWLRRLSRKSACREIGIVTAGGVVAAMPGIVWLATTGAWEHFWTMMLEWNPEYLAAAGNRMSLTKWEFMARRFAPWPWLHLLGVPIASMRILAALRNRAGASRWQVLLSSCYLGWLAQSLVLQHALDYVHVPAILLAIVVIVSHRWTLPVSVRQCAVGGFVVCAILCTPFFQLTRIAQWPVAVSSGSTSDVRAALAHGNLPQWGKLSQVIDKLEELQARSGEVTCLNVHSVHVYNELGIHPATRYWSVNILQELFRGRADEISHDVSTSGHRYVVVEDTESRLTNVSQHQAWLDELDPVFESGSYRVLLVPCDQLAQDEQFTPQQCKGAAPGKMLLQ
jgi:hypothetical protein